MIKKFILLRAFSSFLGIKLALIVVSVFFAIMTQAQTMPYTFSQSSGTYTSVSGLTNFQSGATVATDGVSGAITLPFTFVYNGSSVDRIYISNNGFITLANSTTNVAPAATNYNPIAATAGYLGAISGFGVNLVNSTASGASTSIDYGVVGSSPSREFVVQFTDLSRNSTGASTGRMTFQIRLAETTNVIKIVYGAWTSSSSTTTASSQGVIGLRGVNNLVYSGRQVTSTSPYNTWLSSGGSADNGTTLTQTAAGGLGGVDGANCVLYNSSYLPNTGLTYMWTPMSNYQSLPYSQNFETWSNLFSKNDSPSTNVLTHPTVGNSSWRNYNETVANSLWYNTSGRPALGTAQGAGAASFYNYGDKAGNKGYMDFYLNFSTAGSKQLTFDYINPDPSTVKIYLSTDGGITFGSSLLTIPTSSSWTSATLALGSSTSGTCVVRFEATSTYGTFNVGIDNVVVSGLSACVTPSAQPSALNFGTTSSTSITGSFTAPVSAPSGYLVLRSTSSTAPTPVSGTAYTTGNTVTLGGNSYYVVQGSAVTANATNFTDSGLTSNTNYYYYVFSYNNGCTGAPAYLTASPLTGNKITCATAPTALSVGTITSSGATFTWTSAAGGGAGAVSSTLNIYSNSGYTTLVTTVPNVTSSYILSTGLNPNTTYYYQIVNSNVGGCSSSTNGGSFITPCNTVTAFPYTMSFDSGLTCWTASTGTAVWTTGASSSDIAAPKAGASFAYKPYTTSTQYLYSAPMNLSSFGSNQARLNFWIYRHSATVAADNISFKINTSASNTGATNLQTYPILTTSAPAVSTSGWYNYQVDIPISWNSAGTVYFVIEGVTTGGFSSYDIGLDEFIVERKPDPITITPASATLCTGDSTTLTASSATAYTYSWSPSTGLSATTGATVTANPTTTTTYTVTGTSGSLTATKTITVTVNPAPAAISITDTVSPVSATACTTDYIKLDVAVPSPMTLAQEGFENASYIFSLYASPLANTNFYINSTLATEGTKSIRMNYSGTATGFSQMILTNPINLANAKSATLTFDQIAALEGDTYDYGNPIYSTDGVNFYLMPMSFYSGSASTSTTSVQFDKNSYPAWSAMTSSSTPTNAMWKSETIDLSSLIGNSQVYVGFQMVHDDSVNYNGWSIDNVKVNVTPKVTWSPPAGLYTDAALTTAYVASSNATTLYAAPAGTQSYTATSSLGSCNKTATKSVTRDKYEFRGTISTDWNNSGNWFPAAVPDNAKCVTIPATSNVVINTTTAEVKSLTIASTGKTTITANGSLKVIDDINITNNSNNDNLTLESDAVLLQENGSAVNTGKILAHRDVKMRKTDYTYWSTPVTGQKLINDATLNDGFSVGTPNNRIYYYNEPNDTFKAVPATETTFVNAKGYAIRGKDGYDVTDPTSDTTLKFVGTPNNGSYSIGVQKSANTGTGGTVEHGYNMIGNPYPSNIDFVKFFNLGNNKNVIHGKAWFWTTVSPSVTQQGSTYLGNNYATLTLAGGTPPTYSDTTVTPFPTSGAYTPTKNIKVGQGFIVQAKNIGTGQTLTFDNTIRNNGSGVFYNNNKESDEVNRYWLKLISPQNIINTILIAHMDEATNNYEGDYDADVLVVGDDSFYSKVDAHKLQIQARASFTDVDMVPVGTKYSANGIYKISLENREGIFMNNQNVYLKDKLLNTITNLKEKDYSFTANKGTDETRFEIVYKDNVVLASDSVIKSEFEVYKSNGDYIVKSSKPLGKIEVYDTSGRLMMSAKTKETSFRLDGSVLINGIYVIKAENSGDIRTKKIIK